jgi:hypothetical protein
MDKVLAGLGDVDEDAGEKLERVDEGFIVEFMKSLGLVDEEPGIPVIAKPREVHRGPHQVAGELVESFGVGRVDDGSVVNAETGIAPGQEKLDALLGKEVSVSEKSQDLVPEEEPSLVGVDEGNGLPRAVIEENPAGDHGVNANLTNSLDRTPEGRWLSALDAVFFSAGRGILKRSFTVSPLINTSLSMVRARACFS